MPGSSERREATVLHADLDAFYASVEQRDDPSLRGRPVIVGVGVVLAASYEAKARGVRTAMNGGQARAVCPEAIVVPPRMAAYSAASKDVFAIFRDTTPLVEGLSVDEAFLEVSGLRRSVGTPEQVAVRLRSRVAVEVGLAITVGVARTKFLAKVASGVAKPDGLLVVEPDDEAAFLHPLAVERLWGVGPVTSAKLHGLGVRTVGDVAALDVGTLESLLGRAAARHLHALAHLRDPRPVEGGRTRRSIGSQRALGRSPRSEAELDVILSGTIDRLARRLRDGDRVCRTVVLRLRLGDYTRITRSRTLRAATESTATLLDTARELMAAALPTVRDRGVTLLGVSLSGLDDESTLQLELPVEGGADGGADDARRDTPARDTPARDTSALDGALDAVRARFGAASVSRATQLGRDQGVDAPLLPEHE